MPNYLINYIIRFNKLI